jgi:hypothetical protein
MQANVEKGKRAVRAAWHVSRTTQPPPRRPIDRRSYLPSNEDFLCSAASSELTE